MNNLSHSYISVIVDKHRTYGGGQQHSPSVHMEKWGCGVVAAVDLLLYLCRNNPEFPENVFDDLPQESVLSSEYYNLLLKRMASKYLPIIPGSGINGLMLSAGINAYFLVRKIPYRAVWGVPHKRIWSEIENMLNNDIPVILSIGPDFPCVWRKNSLPLYTLYPNGRLMKTAETRGHYVTATGLDDEWITVASWGRKYLINREEYSRYARKHTTGVLSNILTIKHR